MKSLKSILFASFLGVVTLGFSSYFDNFEECTSGADESASYYGNCDMHVGRCLTPPDPQTV